MTLLQKTKRALWVPFFVLMAYAVILPAQAGDTEQDYKHWTGFYESKLWYLRTYDTEAYDAVLGVIHEAVEEGVTGDELMWRVMQVTSAIQSQYLAHAELAVLDKALQLGLAQVNYYFEHKAVKRCSGLFGDGPAMMEAYRNLPEKLNGDQILEAAIISVNEKSYPVPSAEQAMPIINGILDKLQATYGDKAYLAIGNPDTAQLELREICVINRDMSILLSKLPDKEREMALRFLYAPASP